MKKPKPSGSRAYGKQAKGKTIKSLSLYKDVADRAAEEAARRGISLSALVNEMLRGTIKLGLLVAGAWLVWTRETSAAIRALLAWF